MKRVLAIALVCAGCRAAPTWSVTPSDARAGEATVSGAPAVVSRLDAEPRLDGKLDDAAWAHATSLGPFGDCGDGHAISRGPVAAFARVGWDERALYVGVVVRDDKPASPFLRDDVDPHVWGASSGIELMLQPGDPGDNRDYYELQIDVNGAVFDSHFDDYNQPITGTTKETRVFGHQDWASHVERAITVDAGHFYAIEFALPFSALAPARVSIPPRPGDVWRANFYSFRDGQRQAACWSPLRGEGNFHRSARFGRLQFR
jgi:hypothetical protein